MKYSKKLKQEIPYFIYSGSGVLFVNENETKTLHKRGFRNAFWVSSKRFNV